MSHCQKVESTIRSAYEARVRGDLDGVMAHFAENAHFSLAGDPALSPVPVSVDGKAAIRAAMGQLLDAVEFLDATVVDIIAEEARAAVHWRIRLRAGASQESTTTEIVDLIRLEGDHIVSLRQFVDTAFAAKLLGG